MSGQNLRSEGPVGKGGQKPVDVKSTAMLNTSARESAAHNTSNNTQGKHITTHKPYGGLGAKGHGGA
jgi:hypothetical protein